MFTANGNVCFNLASASVRFGRNWKHPPASRQLPPWLIHSSLLATFFPLPLPPYPRQANLLPLHPHFLWCSVNPFSNPRSPSSLKLLSSVFLPPLPEYNLWQRRDPANDSTILLTYFCSLFPLPESWLSCLSFATWPNHSLSRILFPSNHPPVNPFPRALGT